MIRRSHGRTRKGPGECKGGGKENHSDLEEIDEAGRLDLRAVVRPVDLGRLCLGFELLVGREKDKRA